MNKKKKTIAEIWVGGMSHPAYRFTVEKSRLFEDGNLLITAEDGTEFAVSPHNVVFINFYENEGEDNEQRETD